MYLGLDGAEPSGCLPGRSISYSAARESAPGRGPPGPRVLYSEAHALLAELADATVYGTRKEYMAELADVPLLIIDGLGMRKLPHTAAEELLELVMRRYECASTLLTSNRPVDDWGKLLGDTVAVTALLDCLLHRAHILKCGPRSWRTKTQADLH
jgi:DNA replication protein DnaC